MGPLGRAWVLRAAPPETRPVPSQEEGASWDFPGGPVAKTPQGARVQCLVGVLRSHKLKKEKKGGDERGRKSIHIIVPTRKVRSVQVHFHEA